MDLTAQKADILVKCPKIQADRKTIIFPSVRQDITVDFLSIDKRSKFRFFISRKGFRLLKLTYFLQLQKKNIQLSRYDINGPPHKNPESENPLKFLKPFKGKRIEGDHIHIYTDEVKPLAWAVPAEVFIKKDLADSFEKMKWFAEKYIHITRHHIQRGLE